MNFAAKIATNSKDLRRGIMAPEACRAHKEEVLVEIAKEIMADPTPKSVFALCTMAECHPYAPNKDDSKAAAQQKASSSYAPEPDDVNSYDSFQVVVCICCSVVYEFHIVVCYEHV